MTKLPVQGFFGACDARTTHRKCLKPRAPHFDFVRSLCGFRTKQPPPRRTQVRLSAPATPIGGLQDPKGGQLPCTVVSNTLRPYFVKMNVMYWCDKLGTRVAGFAWNKYHHAYSLLAHDGTQALRHHTSVDELLSAFVQVLIFGSKRCRRLGVCRLGFGHKGFNESAPGRTGQPPCCLTLQDLGESIKHTKIFEIWWKSQHSDSAFLVRPFSLRVNLSRPRRSFPFA